MSGPKIANVSDPPQITAEDIERVRCESEQLSRAFEARTRGMEDVSDRVPLADLQREAAMVNDLNGVKAFCVGAFHEILYAKTVEEARTFAEMAIAALAEHTAGVAEPGTREDPADWRPR